MTTTYGMIGLGRMGGNMTERLLRAGHQLVVYDPNPAAAQAVQTHGATVAADLPDLALSRITSMAATAAPDSDITRS